MAAPKKSPIVAKPPRPKIPDFRNAIAKAEAEGVAKDMMVLRLTLRDMSDLKRDSGVALHEISFAGGAMRFLGVMVVGGNVTESALDTSGPYAEVVPMEPAPKKKAPAKPRAKAKPKPKPKA